MFLFTKEMAKILKEIRIKANLSQTEVGTRIGLKPKNAPKYISNLEAGKITNPTLRTILNYLRACGSSWPEFFKELDIIDFKMRHEKMIAQVHPPPTERKIQRDAMKYEINIEFPSKAKEEIDFDRLKKQIKDKVIVLLTKNQIEERQINSYQKFALEYFDFLATLNKAGMKMVAEKWQRAGLKLNLLLKIKKTINTVLRGEIKRITAKKPLPTEKQEKMAIGFTKYRIRIEQIEAEVHKLLCELGVKTPWFSLYKDFTRQCYQTLKKYYGKDQEKLAKSLTELVQRWQKEGLEEKVLLKVKDKVISVFGDMRRKGRV
jgi:transcriptional regulator with XRE-family HTH domain